MIPRHLRQLFAAVTVVATAVVAAGCEKVPLLAPTGSSITLTTPTTALSANGSATIVAQVLESSGTPPHSGTRVTFMTTLGAIEPSETSTDASGRATVTFRANGASGIAEISASSGGATTSGGATSAPSTSTTTTTTTATAGSTNRNLTIYVGTAAVGRVLIVASPAVLPTAGGTTTITANILDRNGNPLASAPVTFSTTAGTMSASVVSTDAQGNAVAALTTFQSATVTATVGLSSGTGGGSGSGSGGTGGSGGTAASTNQASVTVSLTSAPTLSITPPTTPPSAGLPSSFTFKVTPASTGSATGSNGTTTSTGSIPIRELVIDWGDGARDNLGAVSGDQIVAHTFRSAGSYSVTATVTDVAGGTARVATVVSVIAVPRPTIIVTPTPQSAVTGSTISIRIEITAPAGLAISNVVIDFGDSSTPQALGGATGVILVPHVYNLPTGQSSGTYNILVSVTDSTNQTTVGSSVVSITR